MKATCLRRITIVLAALMVSACAGLRPDSEPMAFAGSSSAPAAPGLHEGVAFSVNFDAALRQAQDLRKRGEFDSASRMLGQLVIAAPNDARVIGEYGKVMLESGHTEDAVAFLERAITLKDTDWTLFSALGIAYDQSGKAEAARAAFNHALALKPGEPAVLTNLALSHIQAGELDEAERLLLQASEHEKDVPGLADKLAMVRSLKGATRQSSALTAPAATEPVAGQRPDIQTPQPDAAPSAPAPMVEPPQNGDEEEPATPDDPETETVALEVQPSAVVTVPQPNPIKSIAPVPRVQDGAGSLTPNALSPPPKIASVSRPAARPVAPRASASSAPPIQPGVAVEPKRTERAATPRPQPAGVTRAITRTATIPLVVTPPSDSWESIVRVSLPSPSAAVQASNTVVATDLPMASQDAEPSGWFGTLRRWSSAVSGFINHLWLSVFPEDTGTA
jgi:Flp pilus assembly protein TadD